MPSYAICMYKCLKCLDALEPSEQLLRELTICRTPPDTAEIMLVGAADHLKWAKHLLGRAHRPLGGAPISRAVPIVTKIAKCFAD